VKGRVGYALAIYEINSGWVSGKPLTGGVFSRVVLKHSDLFSKYPKKGIRLGTSKEEDLEKEGIIHEKNDWWEVLLVGGGKSMRKGQNYSTCVKGGWWSGEGETCRPFRNSMGLKEKNERASFRLVQKGGYSRRREEAFRRIVPVHEPGIKVK